MKQIEHLDILVVGDIMLDKYTIGTVERISPEAPVPILNIKKEYYTLGGCGNVVRNIREIGAQVDCLSSIGEDYSGQKIKDLLKNTDAGDSVIYGSKQTTVKNRIIANDTKTQLLRIDKEAIQKVDHHQVIKEFQMVQKDKYDIIIISDYAKGMITPGLMTYLKTLKNQPKIIVDPKPINGFLYNDVYMVTPNRKEWEIMQLSSAYNLKGVKYILETKGSEGMILHEKESEQKIKSTPQAVYNVSGAGDTVIATMAVCIALGLKPREAAKVANKCAGYVVTKPGTSTVPKEHFEWYFKKVLNQ